MGGESYGKVKGASNSEGVGESAKWGGAWFRQRNGNSVRIVAVILNERSEIMAKRTFSVHVDGSPRYPMPQVYLVEATKWHTAITEGVRRWFNEHKSIRATRCRVDAYLIKGE